MDTRHTGNYLPEEVWCRVGGHGQVQPQWRVEEEMYTPGGLVSNWCSYLISALSQSVSFVFITKEMTPERFATNIMEQSKSRRPL